MLVSLTLCLMVGIGTLTFAHLSPSTSAGPNSGLGTSSHGTSSSQSSSRPESPIAFRSHPAIRAPVLDRKATIEGGGSYSANWGGDIACATSSCGATSAVSGVTAVGASWQVSSVAPTSTAIEAASTWIGIGGWGTSDLVQAGVTAQVVPGGGTYYETWWEMLPAGSTEVFLSPDSTVSPGDHVSVEVAYQGTDSKGGQLWQFTLGDQTTSSTWQGTEACDPGCTLSSFSTAEWIQESPEISGALVQMPAFSSFSFTDPEYYLGGVGWSYLSDSTPNLNWVWQENPAFTSEATAIPDTLYPLPNVLYMDYVVDSHVGPTVNCCSVSRSTAEPGQLVQGGVNLSAPDSVSPSQSSNLGMDLALAGPTSTVCRDRSDGVTGFDVSSQNSYPVSFRPCEGTPYGTYYVQAEVWYVPPGGAIAGAGSLLLSTVGGWGSSPSFTVYGPTDTVPVSSPASGSLDSGQRANFSTTASGGSGGYSFKWGGLPPGCQTENASTIACTRIIAGTYRINVSVTDSVGATFTSQPLDFTVEPDPTVTTPVADRASADAGQTITFSVVPGGGTGIYVFHWAGVPTSGCSGTTGSTVTCVSIVAQSLAVQASIIDSAGMTATSGTLTYLVHSDPSVSPVRTSRLSSDVGQTVVFSVVASGGSGFYSYSWSGLPTGCSSANDSVISCDPTGAGSFSLTASVTDSNGAITQSGYAYTVHPLPTVSPPSANPSSILLGDSATFNVSSAEGSGGLAFTWLGLPPGCTSVDGPTLTCTPTSSGTWSVTVTVADSNNGSAISGSLSFAVQPSFLGLPALEGYALFIGAPIVLGIALVVVLSHRRRRSSGLPRNLATGGGGAGTSAQLDASFYSAGPTQFAAGSTPGGGVPEAGVSPVRFEEAASPQVGLDPGSVSLSTPLINPPDPNCWNCHYQNDPGSRYCSHCAVPLEPPATR